MNTSQPMMPLNDRLLKAIGKSKTINEKVDSGNYQKGNIDPTAIPTETKGTQYLDASQLSNQHQPRQVSESTLQREVQQRTQQPQVNPERQEMFKKSKIPNAIKESFMKRPPIVGQQQTGTNSIGASEAERMRELMGESTPNVSAPTAAPTSTPSQPSGGNMLNELSSYGLKAVINEAVQSMIPQIIEEVKKAEKEAYEEATGGDKLGVRIGDQIFICEVLKVKDVK